VNSLDRNLLIDWGKVEKNLVFERINKNLSKWGASRGRIGMEKRTFKVGVKEEGGPEGKRRHADPNLIIWMVVLFNPSGSFQKEEARVRKISGGGEK